MKTFLLDIFSKIQKYSEKLDNLTLLTNQHWVSINDISSTKTVYIFRNNNELLVSTNGKVEKEKWEYLGNKSLLIDGKNNSYLFKQGFLDGNVLALKVDSNKEYAVFVNENKHNGELNSIESVVAFLSRKYLGASNELNIYPTYVSYETKLDKNKSDINDKTVKGQSSFYSEFITDNGIIYIRLNSENDIPSINNRVYQNGSIAKNGKYKLGEMNYIVVNEGLIVNLTRS